MTSKEYCSIGGTGEVFVNNFSVGTYNGVITVEISTSEHWDYVFTATGANRGCKTYYSVIYRESVDITPEWFITSRSGRSGSCSLPVKDVRASANFNGVTKDFKAKIPQGTIPDSSNSNDFYPNGFTGLNLHGSSEQDALPKLFSKTLVAGYNLKIYSQGNLVFNQDYDDEPKITVNCSGTPYDCLNGECILSTTYNTPGIYESKEACELANRYKFTEDEFNEINQLINSIKDKKCG